MKVSEIMSGRVVTIGQREPVIAAALADISSNLRRASPPEKK